MLCSPLWSTAQIGYADIGLPNGEHRVGFRHFVLHDSSRTYTRRMAFTDPLPYRPLAVSLWYPAAGTAIDSEPVTIGDYLEILKTEQEWASLPNEFTVEWNYYPATEQSESSAGTMTQASHSPPAEQGSFPLILYAPSYQASSAENFALCEYLASHGFVVLSTPSRGHDNVGLTGGTVRDAAAQRADLEFLLGKSGGLANVEPSGTILMGFSFGGLSNVTIPMRNSSIAGVISLDGTVKYRPEVIFESNWFDRVRFRIPFVHFSQKQIPDSVLFEQGIPTAINTDFLFLDTLTTTGYEFGMNHLSHSYFATMGVLFQARDERQDRSYEEIVTSYRNLCRYVLATANQMVKPVKWDHRGYLDRLSLSQFDTLVRYRAGKELPPTNADLFREQVAASAGAAYTTLRQTYASIRQQWPDYRPPEGDLNTLGLQLIFDPETFAAGVRVFEFALSLYPESANLYDSLAEGYRIHGDIEQARKYFRKSLELYEGNTNAVRRLKEME